jgi:pyrroloquinoline quinone biosynthesis protein B
MELFSELSDADKQKVHFIHFNHTNPLLIEGSAAQKEVFEKGFNLAKEGLVIGF